MKQKHSTTVYHLIWAELAGDTLTLSFVEKKRKKTRTVCITAALQGSTIEEAAEWVEDLLNVAYKGAVFLLSGPSRSGNQLRLRQTPSEGGS